MPTASEKFAEFASLSVGGRFRQRAPAQSGGVARSISPGSSQPGALGQPGPDAGQRAFTRALVIGLFAFIAVLNARLWLIEFPAPTDWPNHLARHAIQCADPELGGLSAFYAYKLPFYPYLASDLVHALPIACSSVRLTQKFLIQYSVLALVLATVLLHFSIWRRWSVWPVVSALFAHHMNLAWGFENFTVSLPVSILLIAVLMALRQRSFALRVAVLIPLAVLQYLLHLYSFIFVMIVIGCWELWRVVSAPAGLRERLRGVAGVIVGVTIIGLLPALHLLWLLASGGGGESVARFAFGGIESRFTAIFSASAPHAMLDGHPVVIALAAGSLLAVIGLLWMAHRAGGSLKFERSLIPAVLLLSAIAVATPHLLAGTAWTHIRLPVLIVMLLIAAIDIRASKRVQVALAAVVLMIFALRVEWLERTWSEHSREVEELVQAASSLGRDDRVLVAYEALDRQTMAHLHSSAHVGMRTGAFVPGLFTGQNGLTAKPAFAAHARQQMFPASRHYLVDEANGGGLSDEAQASRGLDVYWRGWRSFYSHVLVLGSDPDPDGELAAMSRNVIRGSFFGIFEISK